MVMQMRGDKCNPGRGKWVKIPLLPEMKEKGVLTTSEPSETLERVTTNPNPIFSPPNLYGTGLHYTAATQPIQNFPTVLTNMFTNTYLP